ncbi:hypothetical protein OMO38_04955 [Chryseobacterium sp. 09-1422]|uniref:Uncharacterized protein n=1 Tax=Chryseobacterium kimseyorum TaxID=2984028 RepID=A0ABT3HVZ2_9FLAO|nr:hypothetical protein [Chryseobacterium kimseyorum]MCW3167870.1 hypothetical protein [Chryseobacterium kimseyorum]
MVLTREIFFPDFFTLLIEFNEMKIVTVVLFVFGTKFLGLNGTSGN